MTMESDLQAVLETCCPNVYPVAADPVPAGSFVTWQLIGGQPWRYMDNQAADARHSMVQVNTWAATRAESLTLARAIEDALCASTAFIARPDSEPLGDVDDDTDRRGCLQDFSIWGTR